MNEQLQNALAAILGKTVEGIDASVEFMQAELPDVINQLLMWYAVKGVVLSGAWVIMTAVVLYSTKKIYNSRPEDNGVNFFWEKNSWQDSNTLNFGTYIALGCAATMLLVTSPMLTKFMDTLQIWVAPKIWIIEYAASLAK